MEKGRCLCKHGILNARSVASLARNKPRGRLCLYTNEGVLDRDFVSAFSHSIRLHIYIYNPCIILLYIHTHMYISGNWFQRSRCVPLEDSIA